MIMKTEIVKYNKEWEKLYRAEAKKIKKELGKNCVSVQHIRDTSFKCDVCAVNRKIELRVMATVKKIDDISADALFELGYGQTSDGYKKEGDIDTILWIRSAENLDGKDEILRETSLRDYLVSHPEKAKAYAEYKAKCAEDTDDISKIEEATENFFDALRPEIDKWTKEQYNISMGISLGMCFGMSIGLAIGSAMGNTALGMTTGMSIGMCLGIALAYSKNKNNNG